MTVPEETAPRCSVGSRDLPVAPGVNISYTRTMGPRDVLPALVPLESRVDVQSFPPRTFANSCLSAMRTTRGCVAESATSCSPTASGWNTSALPVSSSVTIDWAYRNMCVTACEWIASFMPTTTPARMSSSNKCPSFVPIQRKHPRSVSFRAGRNSRLVILKSFVFVSIPSARASRS